MKHTPTPWTTTEDGLGIIAEHNKYISVMTGNWAKGEGEANAKLIVKAVNNHENMLNVLYSVLDYFNQLNEDIVLSEDELMHVDDIKQAIQQAEGE